MKSTLLFIVLFLCTLILTNIIVNRIGLYLGTAPSDDLFAEYVLPEAYSHTALGNDGVVVHSDSALQDAGVTGGAE